MARRKLRPAIEIISDIGCLGFDLQHHSDRTIAEALAFVRTGNPEMFEWLGRVLTQPSTNVVRDQMLGAALERQKDHP